MSTVYPSRKATAALFIAVLICVYFISPTAEAANSRSVDFDAPSSQYLSKTSPAGLPTGSSARTIEAWIKTTATNGQAVLEYGTDADLNHAWLVEVSEDQIAIRLNGSNTFWTANDVTDGNWHHIAFVYTGSGTLNANTVAYMDNVVLAQASAVTGTPDTTNNWIYIGAAGTPVAAFFDGTIDEVRVWNVARSAADIADNRDTELNGDEPGLVGYWKLNGTLEDATANGNDLTNNNGVTFSTDTPFGEEEINPVIVVPGILGSLQQHDVWVIDPILHTYDDLIATLDENGYTLGEDLFAFGYDWRNSNVTTAQLLKAKIDEVKNICGCAKVDLVAHSMGGLVARQYMQSGAYEDDVDQLIFLGTPHRGAPKAYLMWEGGAFVTPSVFDRLTQLFLKGDARKNGFDTAFEYLRGHPVAAVGELLPDYSYLFDDDVLRAYPTEYPANPFLESLNANVQTLLDAGSTLYSFVSGDHDTITGLNVVPAPEKAPLWEHGYPDNFDLKNTDRGLILGAGDQTVPVSSASFVNENLAVLDAKHGALPEDAAGDIVEILRGEPATTIVDDWNVPNIKVLMFQMFSPADMLVTDPTGKKIGTDNDSEVNEISAAFYAGPEAEREIITIPNPLSGIYTIEVRGTGTGAYTLESTYVTDNAEDTVSRSGDTSPGASIIHSVDLHEDTDPLEIAATFASTLADLDYAYASGWVETGAYHSLKAKLKAAQLLEGKSANAQRAILESVKKELEKRQGMSVKQEAYDLLIEDINSLL